MNYLLTATILLFVIWPAYALLLRYSDRYLLNRCLLLLAMVAVCALPFVSLPSPAPAATQSVRGTVSFLEESVKPSIAIVPEERAVYLSETDGTPYKETPKETTTINVLPLVYGIGLGLMLLVLGIRLLLVLSLHLRSRLNENASYRLLHPGATPGQAFTFGRNLYFSTDVPDDADFRHIFDHERVHARQVHTLDVLLSEFFLCVFWFHPAAWWLRAKTRANLEYLVDQAVVSGGADRRSYQLALVRQSQGAYGLALALPFSEPTLKSRIARMTGLPEYRVVALLAAVALVFWLGVSLLVVNGTVFGDEPPVGREYLEAAAHPGDPYYEHYQDVLPQELTSLEVYTNRMVTVDEYLQLRAILGKVPGAKLYVYKNRFDEGYSLELRYGNHEHATAKTLPSEASENSAFMLGIEQHGTPAQFSPVAMYLDAQSRDFGDGGPTVFYKTSVQPSPSIDFLNTNPAEYAEGLMVYVNRKKVELIKQPNFKISVNGGNDKLSVRLNGQEISDFGAEDWPRVLVEGRSQPKPEQRIRVLLDLPATPIGPESSSVQSAHQEKGTYREWYDGLRHLKDQPVRTYYNDRKVSLDFLLDTEFGDNAIITHGINYETNMGKYALQVIDDSPVPDGSSPKTALSYDFTFDAKDFTKVDLFFRRLPTPAENFQINQYLTGFPGINLRVFQDCKNGTGDYTLYFGNASGTKSVSSILAVGEVQNGPVRFSLNKDELGVPTINNYRSAQGPREAPASELYLLIDGVLVNIHSDSAEPYSKATLDGAPDATAIQCKLSGLRNLTTSGAVPLVEFWSNQNRAFWMFTYKAAHPGMLEGLQARLKEEGYGDRRLIYVINDYMTTDEEFDQYTGEEGAYVRMGTWSNIADAPIILEIVE